MGKLGVFLDADVTVSSLISSTGAAYLIVNELILNLFVSNFSLSEVENFFRENKLKFNNKSQLLKRVKIVVLKQTPSKMKLLYQEYVYDLDDTHILAAAIQAKTGFLLTYNLKDFKISKILDDFHIKVMTPGVFIQYLRST